MATSDRIFIQAVAGMAYENPFTPARLDLEQQALGDAYAKRPLAWNLDPYSTDRDPNVAAILDRSERLLPDCRKRLLKAIHEADSPTLSTCAAFGLFWLFHRYIKELDSLIKAELTHTGEIRPRARFWPKFKTEAEDLFGPLITAGFPHLRAADTLAFFYQVRRAFLNIFTYIIGASSPAKALRARVWNSIFTHNLARYQRGLHSRMADIATLITGPSGTGKELIARAIGWSQFIPFDESTQSFTASHTAHFFPLHLAALSPTLIESELFGHRKGAFTGALTDHRGYFETCAQHGSVFLDEIGEAAPEIQVKLLRVLQTRQFQRLGETEPRKFLGKTIAATNRDLSVAMQSGAFREDLFFRLCADRLETVPLHAILSEQPSELPFLVRHICINVAGDAEADLLASEAVEKISRSYASDYSWPGNFRELEQCVRNILVHGECPPPQAERTSLSQPQSVEAALKSLSIKNWTATTLLSAYTQAVFKECGQIEETARRLNLDRRTVKKYLGENSPIGD